MALRFAAFALVLPALVVSAADPCAKIAGKAYVAPADALACQKAFPFNETLRQNVLTNVARVFDFFTFEDYYYNSPPPFQESTKDIRGELARINRTRYATDYDFNRDLYNFTTQLNDGHTRWFPDCYTSFQSLLPAPIVTLEVNGAQNVYVAPDSPEFLGLLGNDFATYFNTLGFDYKRLAGAKVLKINGQDAYDYVDYVARTQSGNYLDHGIRVNSVFSSYRISSNAYSQRFGDLAGPTTAELPGLTFTLVLANSTKSETVFIPYAASFVGNPFTDSASYWANNCAATEATNGVDYKDSVSKAKGTSFAKRAQAILKDVAPSTAVGLPTKYQPSLPTVGGAAGVIRSYILPGNETGVIFVGLFGGDYAGFQSDIVSAVTAFKAAGVTKLLIDLTNNGGGYVCLGQFLHQYLAGSKIGYPGFQSTARANTLAKKVVKKQAELGIGGYYYPSNWAYLNDTIYPDNYNYMSPEFPFFVNGRYDPTSQRFHDVCTPFDEDIPENPPFKLSNVAIVGNGNCASTCAMFSTLMVERHGTKVAVFGGKPGERIEYKGMSGNQVLEWPDLDSEIKTADLKNDPLAPPDLLISGNMRVNWRTAWSYFNELVPIAYVSEPALFRYPYTVDTYNSPQNLWTFAAKKLLG